MAAAPSELEFPAVSSPPVSEAKAARLAAEKEWRENPENALDDDERERGRGGGAGRWGMWARKYDERVLVCGGQR